MKLNLGLQGVENIDIALSKPTVSEAVCAQTMKALRSGDDVIVIYRAVVKDDPTGYPGRAIQIPLEGPIIVKESAFLEFADRMFTILDEKAKAASQLPSGSVPPAESTPEKTA